MWIGVDRRDIASATVASIKAALDGKVSLFRTIVHTDHGMPKEVEEDFRNLGADWCERNVPGARRLIEKYQIPLPERVEQHDLSEAKEKLGWQPSIGILEFLRDLKERDERGEEVTSLWVPSELPV